MRRRRMYVVCVHTCTCISYIYIYIQYVCVCVYVCMYICNPGHRVSRPRGTGSVGDSVGEGTKAQDSGSCRVLVLVPTTREHRLHYALTQEPCNNTLLDIYHLSQERFRV